MASTNNPTLNLNISFSDPETAAAFANALGSSAAAQELLKVLSGSGTAAQNHRRNTPKAVADAPAGETDKDLREWFKAHEQKTGTTYEPTVPMRGKLSKEWREWIIALRAEVDGGTDQETPAEITADVVVDSEEEITEPAPEPERKFRRRGQKASA